jgi:hypothetical protein
MRHPRVIIAGLGLAAVDAAGTVPSRSAAAPATDTARHPGGRANDHRRHQPH